MDSARSSRSGVSETFTLSLQRISITSSASTSAVQHVLQDLWKAQRSAAAQRSQVSPFSFGPTSAVDLDGPPPFMYKTGSGELQGSIIARELLALQPCSPLASPGLRATTGLLGAPMGPPPLRAVRTSSLSGAHGQHRLST